MNKRVEELMRDVALRAVRLPEEFDAAQAADLLMLDRGFVTGLLDAGDIPSHGVGDARRAARADVLTWHRQNASARLEVLDELAAEAQTMSFYNGPHLFAG